MDQQGPQPGPQQPALSEEQRLEMKTVISAYKDVFSSTAGQVVLRDLEKAHFMNSTTFHPDMKDAILLNEGARNVILRIRALMATDLKKLEEREQHAKKPFAVV